MAHTDTIVERYIRAVIRALIKVAQKRRWGDGELVAAYWSIYRKAPPGKSNNLQRRAYVSYVRILNLDPENYDRQLGKYEEVEEIDPEAWPMIRLPSVKITAKHVHDIQDALHKLRLGPAPENYADDDARDVLVRRIRATLGHLQQRLAGENDEPAAGTADHGFGIAKELRPQFSRFLDEYLGTSQAPVPFGGRANELERLDAWLANPAAHPRLLLSADAGCGKTALLLEWVRRLEAHEPNDEAWTVAYAPISDFADTHRPSELFRCLALRLDEILEFSPPISNQSHVPSVERFIKTKVTELATGRKVLIIIDGLDELLFGQFDALKLFPATLGSVRVVLSARLQAGDVDASGWLRRIGWNSQAPAELFDLYPLDAPAVASLLAACDESLTPQAGDASFVSRLFELSAGNPVVLRHYIHDLIAAARSGEPIPANYLQNLMPGFTGYFENWLHRQQALWRAEAASGAKAVDLSDVDAELSILSFVKGPVESTDLIELSQAIHGKQIVAEQGSFSALRRFVRGDGRPGTGYRLSHPMIGTYLRETRYRGYAGRFKEGILHWGRQLQADLQEGRRQPSDASHYALEYLRRHFEEYQAAPADWLPFTHRSWYAAWNSYDGDPDGFSQDVRAAWRALRAQPLAQTISGQIRCALVLASLRSTGDSVPPTVLVEAVRTNVLSASRAIRFAKATSNHDRALESLLLLAQLPSISSARSAELVNAAIERFPSSTEQRLPQNLALLAPKLSRDQLGLALDIVRTISQTDLKLRAYQSLDSYLYEDQKAPFLQELWNALPKLDRWSWKPTVAVLVPYLSPSQMEELLAGTQLKESDDPALWQVLGPHLPIDCLRREIASGCYGLCIDVAMLASIACQSSAEDRGAAVREAIRRIREHKDTVHASRAFSFIAPCLAQSDFDEALDVAQAIDEDYFRYFAVRALAEYAPPRLADRFVKIYLAAREREPSEADWSSLVCSVGKHLTSDQARPVVELLVSGLLHDLGVLVAVAHVTPQHVINALLSKEIDKLLNENRGFRPLANYYLQLASRYLSGPQRSSLIDLIPGMPIGDRFEMMTALAPHLSADQMQRLLSLANGIDEVRKVKALGSLVPYLSRASEFASKDLAVALAITDELLRADTLLALLPHLPGATIRVTLSPILERAARGENCDLLLRLGSWIVEESAADLLHQVAAGSDSFEDERTRFSMLEILIQILPEQHLSAALAQCLRIASTTRRAWLLRLAIPRLPPAVAADALDRAVDAIEGGWRTGDRWGELAALAAVLASPQRDSIVARACEDAEQTEEHERLPALLTLMPYVEREKREAFVDEAARLVNLLCDRIAHADKTHLPKSFVEAVAAQLGAGVVSTLLNACAAIPDRDSRAEALLALVPHLSLEEHLLHALESAKTLAGPVAAIILSGLAPRLSQPVRSEVFGLAMETAKSIEVSLTSFGMWKLILAELSGTELSIAFRAMLAALETFEASELDVEEIVRLLATYATALDYELAMRKLLEIAEKWDLEHVFYCIEMSSKMIGAITDETAVQEIRRSILEMSQWRN